MSAVFPGTIRAAAVLACAGLAAACGGAGSSPADVACARVVKQYHGLPNPVAIVDTSSDVSPVVAEIRYESTDALNIPVEGSALCTFELSAGDSLRLTSAVIDGEAIPAADLPALNRAVVR